MFHLIAKQLQGAKRLIRVSSFKKRGFTILEVMIAIFVVTIGVLAAHTVTQQIISYTHRSASRLTAIYLDKEGIEIVRNIRDTNWLEEESWNYGLGAGDREADYTNDQNLYVCSSPCDPDNNLRFLKLGAGGFYNYSSGVDTKFKRKITITPVGNTLEVSVEVWWEYKGDTYGPIKAQENLYDWYPE
ncbi:prepilin-type N-terminal cleavage/methylation domain-containing protein [Patescibacteria group bacterium]|nr:prepilin-type N-terminal cleavage/methylation domain-containing protein [Patescibacteria group bacterium]